MERVETLEKELEKAKKMLADKDAELKCFEAADDAKLQEAYYQGQYDCIATVKLEVEASSSLRVESNIPIPKELVIIPNPEIQAIVNDESLAYEVEGAGLAASLKGGTIFAALSLIKEPPRVYLIVFNIFMFQDNSIILPNFGGFCFNT
ncbi:hypothetical protein SO802_004531 [Lithocarpus litseifolius]|uniref:Uncharacterized protein n=1 Tax=Lithocarpus litseifolius TaxID=425828 RepID=A0AAW2E5W1_9ROSI